MEDTEGPACPESGSAPYQMQCWHAFYKWSSANRNVPRTTGTQYHYKLQRVACLWLHGSIASRDNRDVTTPRRTFLPSSVSRLHYQIHNPDSYVYPHNLLEKVHRIKQSIPMVKAWNLSIFFSYRHVFNEIKQNLTSTNITVIALLATVFQKCKYWSQWYNYCYIQGLHLMLLANKMLRQTGTYRQAVLRTVRTTAINVQISCH